METQQNLQGLFSGVAGIDWDSTRSAGQSNALALTSGSRGLPKVSVIIPTLNEAQNLPLVLPFLPMNWIYEVILVDGRSTDGTVEVAQKLLPSIKVVLETKRGKGAAMKAGYNAAKGDILVVLDADGSNDPREIPRFVTTLLQGADMVKGSRFANGGGTTDMPMIRRLGNGAFTLIVNLTFGCVWTDLCYGYHAFWRYCLDWFDLSDVDGFEIDTALYLRAASRELHVTEVPSFEGYRFHGVGKLQAIPDGWRVLKTIGLEWVTNQRRKPTAERYLGFRGSTSPYLPIEYTERINEPSLKLEFIKTLGSILSAGYSLSTFMARALDQALRALDASSGSILILDDTGRLRDGCLSYDGKVQSIPINMIDVVDKGLVGWVAKHRQPALVDNTHEDPRWLRRDWEHNGTPGRTAMVVPIKVNDNHLGVLTLVRPNANRFTLDDLKVLDAVAFSA